MTFIDILRRSWHNIGRAKVRVGLTAAALAIGAATMTLALAITHGAAATIGKGFGDFTNNYVLVKGFAEKNTAGEGVQTSEEADQSAKEASGKNLGPGDVSKFQSIAGVQKVIPLNYFLFDSVELNGKSYKAPDAEPLTPLDQLNDLVAGKREDLKDDTVIIPERYARQAGAQNPADFIGQKLTFIKKGKPDYFTDTTAPDTKVVLTVVGITRSSTNSEYASSEPAYMSPETTSKLTAQTYNLSPEDTTYMRILILSDEAQTEKVKADITSQGYEAETRQDSVSKALESVKEIRIVLLVFAGIAIFTAIFGVINTQLMAVMERTREIGMMKALGLSKRGILFMFSIEAGWIGFIGSIIGTLIALPITLLMNGIGKDFKATITIPNFLLVVAVLVVIAMVSGFFPARRATKLDPVEALRNE